MGTAATPREARAGLLSIPGRSGSRSRRPRLETEMLRLRRWLPGPMALPQPEEGQISGQEPPGLTYGSIRPCWQGWCGQSLQVRRKTGISVESNYPAGSPAALPVPRPCYLYTCPGILVLGPWHLLFLLLFWPLPLPCSSPSTPFTSHSASLSRFPSSRPSVTLSWSLPP